MEKFHKNYLMLLLMLAMICAAGDAAAAFENPRGEGAPMIGLPISAFSGCGEIETDICPEGTKSVSGFLLAWAEEDYLAMFSFIDDPENEGYTLEDAKMDFKFMEYNPYKISSVRSSGDDFEYLVSYGDWKDGDKAIRKIVVNGKTFKIRLQRNRSVFKESLASYF